MSQLQQMPTFTPKPSTTTLPNGMPIPPGMSIDPKTGQLVRWNPTPGNPTGNPNIAPTPANPSNQGTQDLGQLLGGLGAGDSGYSGGGMPTLAPPITNPNGTSVGGFNLSPPGSSPPNTSGPSIGVSNSAAGPNIPGLPADQQSMGMPPTSQGPTTGTGGNSGPAPGTWTPEQAQAFNNTIAGVGQAGASGPGFVPTPPTPLGSAAPAGQPAPSAGGNPAPAGSTPAAGSPGSSQPSTGVAAAGSNIDGGTGSAYGSPGSIGFQPAPNTPSVQQAQQMLQQMGGLPSGASGAVSTGGMGGQYGGSPMGGIPTPPSPFGGGGLATNGGAAPGTGGGGSAGGGGSPGAGAAAGMSAGGLKPNPPSQGGAGASGGAQGVGGAKPSNAAQSDAQQAAFLQNAQDQAGTYNPMAGGYNQAGGVNNIGQQMPSGSVPTGFGGGMPGLFAPSPASNSAAGALVGNAANSFQNAQNQANQANTGLANQITSGYNNLSNQSAGALGGLSGLFGNQQNAFANNANGVQQGFQNLGATQSQGYGNLVNSLAQGQQGISKGYGDVSNAVMGNLSRYGEQQAQQIAQNAQNQVANANQGLVNRGLGNTTIANSVDSGINQNALMANLANEGNTQQMVNNALTSTAGAQLQSQQQGLNNVNQLAQQGLQANTSLGSHALDTGYQSGQDLANLQGQALQFGANANSTQNTIGQHQLDFLNSINQTGPNYNQLAALMQSVGAAGTGYGQNGYGYIPSSAGNVAPSSVLGQLQGPGTAGYGGIPQPPRPLSNRAA